MSTNQSIKPITTKRSENLNIGGCDLIDLANKYGTPLYVIDEATIRAICQDYKKAFANYKNIKMMYASKALSNLAIASILDSEDFGFDTVNKIKLAINSYKNIEKEDRKEIEHMIKLVFESIIKTIRDKNKSVRI